MADFHATFPLREKKGDVDEGAMTSQFYESIPNSGSFYSFNLALVSHDTFHPPLYYENMQNKHLFEHFKMYSSSKHAFK